MGYTLHRLVNVEINNPVLQQVSSGICKQPNPRSACTFSNLTRACFRWLLTESLNAVEVISREQ